MKLYRLLAIALVTAISLTLPAWASAEPAKKVPTVTMRTELDTYSTETERFLVIVENNSSVDLQFGDMFELQRKEGTKWKAVKMKENIGFNSIGYGVKSGDTWKTIYGMWPFAEKLTPGKYRIKITYNHWRAPGDYTEYHLAAPFNIVEPDKFKGVSELDHKGLEKYRDVTAYDVLQNTSAHVYRNDKTEDTVLVYQGVQYPLGQGAGGFYGEVNYLELQGEEYLVYTGPVYAAGGETKDNQACIKVLSLSTCKVAYTSRPMTALVTMDKIWPEEAVDDEALFYVGEGFAIHVSAEGVEAADNTNKKPVGTLVYRGGRFVLDETKKNFPDWWS